MLGKFVRLIVLLALAAILFLLAAIRVQPPSLQGRWRDQSSAALLYEFRGDGSVWLIRDGQDLPVFRYEIEGHIVRFHDGMGRPREYRFALKDNQLLLYDPARVNVVEKYLRDDG